MKRLRRCAPAADAIAEQFLPIFDVREEHHISVRANATATMAAARAARVEDSWLVRALFATRAFMLRAKPVAKTAPQPFVTWAQALGWGILADVPEREIVMGAVTKPWEANVHFRTVAASEFADFKEPGYVKILFTLRVEPLGVSQSVFHTETRVIATDPVARKRFRRYWAMVWPGIILVRLALLPMVRAAAEKGY